MPDTSSPPADPITRADVARLAALVRIDLADDELDRLVPEIVGILDSVAVVTATAASAGDVPATSHAAPLTNVFRADEVQPGLAAADALAAAPAVDQQRFSVPRILGEEA